MRPNSNFLDDRLGRIFSVLDSGCVRVVDYMGNDASIVQAARISYGAGTKHISEDRALIRYLMRHKHTTPFEMCELKLHIRAPMDTWRQWIRHRTANVNEYSTRYSEAIDRMAVTHPKGWRLQAMDNRQGSATEYLPDIDPDPANLGGRELSAAEKHFQDAAWQLYQERLAVGVAREQARKDLPLSTYTEAYWKIDLHNLLHFLALRLDAHAQFEIRQYAYQIADLVAGWVPLTFEAFQEYVLEAVTFSKTEMAFIRDGGVTLPRPEILDVFMSPGERNEFLGKLKVQQGPNLSDPVKVPSPPLVNG